MALLRAGRDCSALPWASPLRASRYGASLRLSKIAPGNFVEPEVSSTHLSPPDTQNASLGGVVEWRCCVQVGIVRPFHGPHPFALRAAGPACGCPNLFLTNLSNRSVRPHLSLRQIRKTPR